MVNRKTNTILDLLLGSMPWIWSISDSLVCTIVACLYLPFRVFEICHILKRFINCHSSYVVFAVTHLFLDQTPSLRLIKLLLFCIVRLFSPDYLKSPIQYKGWWPSFSCNTLWLAWVSLETSSKTKLFGDKNISFFMIILHRKRHTNTCLTGKRGFCVLLFKSVLNTKRRLLYLKAQFLPRSKHFISVIKTNQFML